MLTKKLAGVIGVSRTVLRTAREWGTLGLLLALAVVGGYGKIAVGQSPDVQVQSGILSITGTDDPDSIRLEIDSPTNGTVNVYVPATEQIPTSSFSGFTEIHAELGAGDDLIVFDDSGGILSDHWKIQVEGGDGNDIVMGGIDLNAVSLADALDLISQLRQAQYLVDGALDLIGTSAGIVADTSDVLRMGADDLVEPTALYLQDVESQLVGPTAQKVRDAHARLSSYVETFLADDAQAVALDAQALQADVQTAALEFNLLLPKAEWLLTQATELAQLASQFGCREPVAMREPGPMRQPSAPRLVGAFRECTSWFEQQFAYFSTIAANSQCPEDTELADTQTDDDLQSADPAAFHSPFCAALEQEAENLETYADSFVNDEAANSDASMLMGKGDALESTGASLETEGEALGDDEDPNSRAAELEQEGDALVASGDALVLRADGLNADWEQWVSQTEFDLETAGDTMDNRGQAEILSAAEILRTAAESKISNPAESLRVQAEQLQSDLDSLMVQAAKLLGSGASSQQQTTTASCTVTPTHTFTGGADSDALIGTSGSDLIEGGDGDDLLIGADGDDKIVGGEGRDILLGGSGSDEIRGGKDVDILVGNGGDDCMFGGGGEQIGDGTLLVQLGDLFFGGGGNDKIVSGDYETEILDWVDLAWGGNGDDDIRLSNGGYLEIGAFTFRFGNLVLGQADKDSIQTGDGVDMIFGGDDDDTIVTGKGSALAVGNTSLAMGDLIFGDGGNDTIDADDPSGDRDDDDTDVVFGGDGDDTIKVYGGGEIEIGTQNPLKLRLGNLVFGGADADDITALDGVDVIFGGDGDDTIVTGKGCALAIGSFSLALGDLIFGDGGNDSIDADDPSGDRSDDDIDVVLGGDGNDTIRVYGGGEMEIGTQNPFKLRLGNLVFGGADEDDITALDGIDVIFGGDGDDTVRAGEGYLLDIDQEFSINLGDFIFGQGGDDILHGDTETSPSGGKEDGVDLIFGGLGNDSVYGGTGGTITVEDANFCLVFGNLLFGGPGDDQLRGDYKDWDSNNPKDGIDLIFGGNGDDTIEGAGGSLIVIGDVTSGDAVIIWFGNLLFGGPDNDRIYGADKAGTCNDGSLLSLLGNLGISDLGGAADLIFAGEGDDFVEAYDGIDFIFGSSGRDTLQAKDGGFFIVPIDGVPAPIAFGNLIFGGDGEDVIKSAGHIVPLLEIDLLFGNECDDQIEAGDGLNIVFGNEGNDTITAGDVVNLLFGNECNDRIEAGDGLNIVFGNRDDDTIAAGNGVNVLFGNDGRDAITGADGLTIAFGNQDDDQVHVGSGAAFLFGNAGADDVKSGTDLGLAFGNRGPDIVAAGSGMAVLFGNRDDDDVTCADGLCVAFGNEGCDVVSAGTGVNVLFGNGDDDQLVSGGGFSVLFGNQERDVLQAGAGLLFAFGNAGNDVIVGGSDLNIGFGNLGDDQFFGGPGTDIFAGNSDGDTIRGGGSSDFLFGNAGDDTIVGGAGEDWIFGNRDNDTLGSGAGVDFLFGNRGKDNVSSENDTDADWLFGNRGNDTLNRCPGYGDRAFGGRGNDTKNDSCTGVPLADPVRGEVRGRVLIDLDGNGSGDVGRAGVTVTAGSHSTTTDADGWYRIDGLSVSTNPYAVSQDVPPGFVQLAPVTTPLITISRGYESTRIDFVDRRLPGICGTKFYDLDGDGQLDSGEPVLLGWTITVTDLNGTSIGSAVTDAHGDYYVPLSSGSYIVAETLQPNWTATTSASVHIELPLEDECAEAIPYADVDFGNRAENAEGEICIVKFDDLDGNGKQDPGETGLSGWIFDIPSIGQVITGLDGRVCVKAAWGTYTITEQVQFGWTPTTPNPQTVTVGPGQLVDLLFGNKCQCANPPSGMVSWWPLDETSGPTAHDIVSGFAGTTWPGPIGPVSGPGPATSALWPSSFRFAPGVVGNSLFFDIGQYVKVPHATALDPGTGDFTVDAWVVYAESGFGPRNFTIVKKGNSSLPGTPWWHFYIRDRSPASPTGELVFEVGSASGSVAAPAVAIAPTPGGGGWGWHHVAATLKRGTPDTVVLYVDGVGTTFPFTAGTIGPNIASKEDLYIAGGTQIQTVAIDEVEIFRYALSSTDVHDIFAAGSSGKCKPDLGDAPDSTNHASASMLAYPASSTQAHFPTVYDPNLPGNAPLGPLHWHAKGLAWLGADVSIEEEADTGWDQDMNPSGNNIQPDQQITNRDTDDGVTNVALQSAYPCGQTSVTFSATNQSAQQAQVYINVWFDWTHDGDWDDAPDSVGLAGVLPVPEWAVQNYVVILNPGLNPGLTTPGFLFLTPLPGQTIWMRITLTDVPVDPNNNGGPFTSAADLGKGGSGRVGGYCYGETEDYLWQAKGSTTPCVQAPPDMVSWWPADGNADDIVSRNSGTLLGSAGYAPGVVGRAFSFVAAGDGVSVSNAPNLDFGRGDLSIDTWCVTSSMAGVLPIVDKRGGASGSVATGYTLFLYGGRLAFQLGDGASFNYISSSSLPDLRDGVFHHVAVTVDRDSARGGSLYVDGQVVLAFDPTNRPGNLTNREPLFIGRHAADPNATFIGLIDEVEIFSRALTAGEVLSIFTAGAAGKCR